MSKRFGFPLLMLLAALIIAGAPQAHAGVRFGVAVGPAYPPPPYAYAQAYPYRHYYAYPLPAYGYSYGYWRGYRDRAYWGATSGTGAERAAMAAAAGDNPETRPRSATMKKIMAVGQRGRVRIRDLKEKKARGEKIAMLTAYDAAFARLLDAAALDVLLVGDSLGMVVLGYETTIPVTLDDTLHHTKAVARVARHALVVADMPFLTYQVSVPDAVRNAGRLIQEGGAAAVKIEGGRAVLDVVERLVSVGIPVMGHLGLLPQSVHQLSGFRKQAMTADAAERLMDDAVALDQAGVFAIVLESIPDEVAAAVTERVSAPTIGIGAGPGCDGQVLVCHDAFGLAGEYSPPFARRYAQLGELISAAAREYVEEVRSGAFAAHALK